MAHHQTLGSMDFDKLVLQLEKAMLPGLEERARELRLRSLYSEVRVNSIRHADILHAISIACVPIWSADSSQWLSLCAKIAKHDKLIVRTDVSWGQIFRPGTSKGYVKKEDRGAVREVRDVNDLESISRDWTRLCSRFDKVSIRGRPSSRMVRFLHGAPRDLGPITQNA